MLLSGLSQGGVIAIIAVVIVIILGILIVATNLKLVRQTQKFVVERVGKYHDTWSSGFHMLVPFFDHVANVVSLKEQVKDFEPQPVITKDNVTMQIDTVVFFQVTDPKLFTYGVENPVSALENLSATTLRNIIGELDLDETLTSRDLINTRMRSILDEATDPWGIKVNRVELKNILPPKDIRESMERQMRAERERREKILLAEGQKASAILTAEGEKQSAILKAEAAREAIHLTEATFYALVHMVVGEWHRLEMLYVALIIIVENHTGIQQILRVEELLHLFHYSVGFLAPLFFHEWCHIAPGAVLGFQ